MYVFIQLKPTDPTQGRVMSADTDMTNLQGRTVYIPLDDAIEQAKGFLLARSHEAEYDTLTAKEKLGYDIGI